ncbi:MAG: hypothetical protein LBV60_15635 [Streptomyces sp.]|nr:hypothetical protein [Streptomyces sp.]
MAPYAYPDAYARAKITIVGSGPMRPELIGECVQLMQCMVGVTRVHVDNLDEIRPDGRERYEQTGATEIQRPEPERGRRTFGPRAAQEDAGA